MRYEYEYPDVEDSLINWAPLYNAMNFVNTASSEDFVNEAPERYDIPLFTDYYLFTALLSARDNMGKNLYLSYYNINQASKLVVTPWDIDHSFGRKYNSDEEPTDIEVNFDVRLYQRLKNEMPGYYTQMLARYASLRQDIFSLDSLRQRFTDYFQLFADTEADEREAARWNGEDHISFDFSYEETYIHSWLEQRLVYTDSLFQYQDISTKIEKTYSPSAAHKILHNGQLFIRRSDRTYTLTGQKVQ